jgi:hypothetical protein
MIRMAVRSFDIATVVWSIASVLPDFKFEVVTKAVDGERAVVEWILHGTNTAPLKPGIEAMGKTSRVGIFYCCELERARSIAVNILLASFHLPCSFKSREFASASLARSCCSRTPTRSTVAFNSARRPC